MGLRVTAVLAAAYCAVIAAALAPAGASAAVAQLPVARAAEPRAAGRFAPLRPLSAAKIAGIYNDDDERDSIVAPEPSVAKKKHDGPGEPEEPPKHPVEPPKKPLPPLPPTQPRKPRPPKPSPPPGEGHPYPLPGFHAPYYLKTNISVEDPAYFASRDLEVGVEERWNYGYFELLERTIRVNTSDAGAAKEKEGNHTHLHHRDLIAGALVLPHRRSEKRFNKTEIPGALLAFFKDHTNYTRPAHHWLGDMGDFNGGAVLLFDSVIEFIDTDKSGGYTPGKDKVVSAIQLGSEIFEDVDVLKGNGSTIVQMSASTLDEEGDPRTVGIRVLIGDEVGIEESEGVVLSPRSVHVDIKVVDYPFSVDPETKLAIRVLFGGLAVHHNLSLSLTGHHIATSAEAPSPPWAPYLTFRPDAATSEPDVNGTKGTVAPISVTPLRDISVAELPESPARGFLKPAHWVPGQPALAELYVSFATQGQPAFVSWGATLGMGKRVVLTGNEGKKLLHGHGRWWVYVLAVILLPALGALAAWLVSGRPAIQLQ
ncbi:hypothetical protein DFJ74DRAFT_500019 [Hyaloraphidium curvatum]|nr:hypothetical protein DFJ74DRAFT_500019 [Hyaloraphidium curvatum]